MVPPTTMELIPIKEQVPTILRILRNSNMEVTLKSGKINAIHGASVIQNLFCQTTLLSFPCRTTNPMERQVLFPLIFVSNGNQTASPLLCIDRRLIFPKEIPIQATSQKRSTTSQLLSTGKKPQTAKRMTDSPPMALCS